MDDSTVLRFALISGLIGFAAFCASYTLQVWRRRNAQNSPPEDGWASRLQRASLLLIGAGMLSMGVAVAIRQLDQPEGRLLNEGLFSVRAPRDDLRLISIFAGQRVKQGEILARLESPFADARVRELEYRAQRLERKRDMLPLEPLELDPELVRQQQNTTARRQHLRVSMDQLLPAYDGLVRELVLERLSRLEKSAQLAVQAKACLGELAAANIRRDYAARQLTRIQGLAQTSSVTHSELESWQEQSALVDAELANRQQQLDKLNAEQTQLEESLAQLVVLAEQQQATLRTELELVREDRARTESEHWEQVDALAEDVQRARLVRDGQLDQLRLEILECHAALEGAKQTLEIRAPFDGTVVYRDFSPRSAAEQQPVLAVSQQAGCRLRVRLAAAQAAALERAGEVTIELVEPAIEPYFSGRFLRASVLPHRPRFAVAELTCQPPPDTVRELLEGEAVVSRLRWSPPLLTLLPFRLGIALLVLGVVAWLATGCWLRRRRTPQAECGGRESPALGSPPRTRNARPAVAPELAARTLVTPAAGIAKLEAGSVAGLLELLGARLRESVLRCQLDEDLIAAVEWALDRHHVRAVRQLRVGLQCDDELAECLRRMLQDWEGCSGASGNGKPAVRSDQLERMIRVLKAIAPQLTESLVCCR